MTAGTLLRLVHRDLPDEVREPHRKGWAHYLGRLRIAGAGGDRVPSGSAPVFHVAVYESLEALKAARGMDGTRRFVERLYPEIDRESHATPECDVILSSWTGIQPEDVR